MAGFDGTVPSSPFEKGGRGDLHGVAMRVIVDRQAPGALGTTARDRLGLKSPGTRRVMHSE